MTLEHMSFQMMTMIHRHCLSSSLALLLPQRHGKLPLLQPRALSAVDELLPRQLLRRSQLVGLLHDGLLRDPGRLRLH